MVSTPERGTPTPLALLALTAGPRFGEELAIAAPVVTLGRAPGNDVVIEDDSVSATHARLEWDLGAWRITDLGSTNGTSVEGVKLAPNVPTPLQYGNTVRLGGVRMQFREAAGADPAAARADFVPPPVVPSLREERRSGFRLPVWLLLVILVMLAVLVWAVVELARRPIPAAPAGAPSVAAAASVPHAATP